jgi:hypothetical protein
MRRRKCIEIAWAPSLMLDFGFMFMMNDSHDLGQGSWVMVVESGRLVYHDLNHIHSGISLWSRRSFFFLLYTYNSFVFWQWFS